VIWEVSNCLSFPYTNKPKQKPLVFIFGSVFLELSERNDFSNPFPFTGKKTPKKFFTFFGSQT
jgi:hypothetical protein